MLAGIFRNAHLHEHKWIPEEVVIHKHLQTKIKLTELSVTSVERQHDATIDCHLLMTLCSLRPL